MDPSTSAYIFDEYGMTWITCDLCSGSFQRQLQICELCHGSKLRRVSYDYLVRATSPPETRQGGQPPSPPKDRHDNHGPSGGRGVYNRRS